MAYANWKDREGEHAPAGVYLAEVTAAAEKTTKRGMPMLVVDLADAATGRKLCRDYLVTDGPGSGIGLSRLKALGFREDQAEIVAAELVGKRAWVMLVADEYEGKASLKVKLEAWKDGWCGYRSKDDPPPEVERPDKETDCDPPEKSVMVPVADDDGMFRGKMKAEGAEEVPF